MNLENIVKGEGPHKCLMALIGEAPGAEEEKQHRPFVGPAGNLLNTKLHLAGIARQECYITNLVKLRPPDNDFSIYWIGSGNNRRPTDELMVWRDHLLKELDSINTNVFIPLGVNAMWALTSYTQISKWRGSILECKLPSGRIVKTIPTYHPSACLRDWTLGTIMTMDLIRAKGDSEFSDLRLPIRKLHIEPTFLDVLELSSKITDGDCSFDIETSPRGIECISFSTNPNEAISIPTTEFYWGSYSELKRVMELVQQILSHPNVVKVGQNMSYDIQYLVRFFGIFPRKPWFDTMVAQHSCYCELPKGLDFLASMYTRERYYKDDLKLWIGGFKTEKDLWTYNARDAAVTLEVKQCLVKEMNEGGYRPTFDFIMELLEPLLYMMLRGVKFSEAARKSHVDIITAKILEMKSNLKEEFGDFNPQSPKQVAAIAYDKLGLKPITKDGKITTNKDAIKKLSRKHSKMQLIADVRSESTVLSNYGEVAIDTIDRRLRCSFNATGTSTRRLSSSESVWGSGRNLQNWPKRMRDMIVADEGMIFTEADLSGAESRVVAYLSGDPIGITTFESGKNIHTITACLVFDMTVEQVKEDKEKCDAEGRDTQSKYFISKKLRHSIEKAGSWVTVSEQLNIPAPEAKDLVARFYKMNPNLPMWFKEVELQLRKNRTIITPFGDKRIFLDRFGPQLLKEAVAHIAQDVVGKIINSVINGIYYNLCKEYNDIEVLLQVHDSVLIQHLPEHKDLVYKELPKYADVKIPYKGGVFTIPLEMKSGFNWRDMK